MAMNIPKINCRTSISFHDKQRSGVIAGGNSTPAALLLTTALVLIFSPIVGLAQGSITVTSGATPGNQISVEWTLTGPANRILEGNLFFYLNSLPLPNPNAAAQTTVQGNEPASGKFKFTPVPGCNLLTVSLIKQLTNKPAKPPIPKTLPIPSPGHPAVPPSSTVSPAPVENPVLASVTSKCIYATTPAVSLTGSDGLITADNRKQLLSDYAPLFLYSYDHGHDEKYAPIDVVSYIQDSSLVSQESRWQGIANSALSAASGNSPLTILNPPVAPPNTQQNAGVISTLATPLNFFLEPSTAGQNGDWITVTNKLCSFASLLRGCQSQNVGLYARASLVDLGARPLLSGQTSNDPSLPIAALRARYGCTTAVSVVREGCPAQVIKLEYWQFYGYSHDYDAEGSIFALLGPQINQLINQDLTDHDGDWCTVQVYVDANWWKSAPDLAIVYVSHYFHGFQAGFDMDSVEQAPTSLVVPSPSAGNHGTTYPAMEYLGPHSINSVDLPVDLDGGLWLTSQGPNTDDKAEKLANATNLSFAQNNTLELAQDPVFSASGARTVKQRYKHPVVYVEWGGHEFWPTSGWSIAAASKHNGLGTYSYFGDAPVDVTYLPAFSAGAQTLPSPPPSPDVELVTLFSGFWGAPQKHNPPPPGPPLHCEWYWDPSWDPETPNSPNLLVNLEAGQSAPTDPLPGQLLTASNSQGVCGADRAF